MSLDIYFRKDIMHTLEALYVVEEKQHTLLYAQVGKIVTDSQQKQELTGQMETYQSGYQDAILATALAFGIRKTAGGMALVRDEEAVSPLRWLKE